VDTNEAGASMITSRFAHHDFAIGLCIGHSGLDFVQNLLFAEAGVFQARDLGRAQRGMALQAALQDELNEIVGQTDKAESHGVSADGIELIGASDVKNLRFGISRASEVSGCIAAGEGMFPFVSGGDESYASIVAQSSLLDLDNLRNFPIRGIQLLELLNAAGPHAGSVERAIVRQHMTLATDRGEDQHTEKQGTRLHVSILAGGKRNARTCAVGGTGAEGQVHVNP
jgi:hypothetical protein